MLSGRHSFIHSCLFTKEIKKKSIEQEIVPLHAVQQQQKEILPKYRAITIETVDFRRRERYPSAKTPEPHRLLNAERDKPTTANNDRARNSTCIIEMP